MRSKRPATGTELYELVEQADALQQLVNCLAVNDLDVEFFKISIPIYKTVEYGKPLLSITFVWWCFLLLPQDCSNDAEEYAFPFRLSKAISKGNPLDGMVEVMCSRIYATVTIVIGSHSQDCLHIISMIDCRRDKWYLNLKAHQEKSICLKIALICGNQFFASNKCDEQIMSDRNVSV
ncbi:conserved hypothetical protein [Trichinella spiralis]|uniref:hypothetical protein n=1 Tax=Trichinella spiralis TaxID=6334 RepID=UPI0001EFEE9B|nr:conserved hypothetical protein [Trichinella spiralis]